MLKDAQREKGARDTDPFGALAGAGGGAVLWARQGTACAERGDLVGALQCFQRSLEILCGGDHVTFSRSRVSTLSESKYSCAISRAARQWRP